VCHNNSILKMRDIVASDNHRVVSADFLPSNLVSESLISRIKLPAKFSPPPFFIMATLVIPLVLFGFLLQVLFLSFELAQRREEVQSLLGKLTSGAIAEINFIFHDSVDVSVMNSGLVLIIHEDRRPGDSDLAIFSVASS